MLMSDPRYPTSPVRLKPVNLSDLSLHHCRKTVVQSPKEKL